MSSLNEFVEKSNRIAISNRLKKKILSTTFENYQQQNCIYLWHSGHHYYRIIF